MNINSVIDPSLLDKGIEIRLKNGEILTQQFAKANDFYLMKSGRVRFFLSMDDSGGEIEVGESDTKLTPIGWSGFNSPGRYATTVKVDSLSATFIKWNHEELREILEANPELGTAFLRDICGRARDLIKIAVKILNAKAPSVLPSLPESSNGFTITAPSPEEDLVKFLRKSAFFEAFDEVPLEFLSQNVERRMYAANEIIYTQDKKSDGLFILGMGKVRFSYHSENQANVSFTQITTPGFVLSWASSVFKANIINAHAVQDTLVYFVPQTSMDRIIKLNPTFSPQYFKRLLWLISHQLQAIRARIIASRLNHEVVAISNLIDQNSARLTLTSPLHKIPHLLDNKLTVTDAIDTLENLKEHGTSLEKTVALSSLDILEGIRKEQQFYKGLVNVYNSVVGAPKDLPAEQVRKISATAYMKIFDHQDHIIKGQENLPEKSGNIFIYNHLRNHTYNTLPNQFQITLDSHFISSMVLMKKYGDPGLRIVRVGLSKEFAHQEYYQRLGHIDVFTEDSGTKPKKLKKQVRQMFYNEAGAHLAKGGNLIISPEGNSYSTEESPGPFKSGAFNLALSMKKEPWIVPVAMANFEKRARNNCFSCLILPPFKVSDYISDPESKTEMKQFLSEYQETYRAYVERALEQSRKS
ncbi:1-acyl-sn-glycerol-3-phosphate acyltransferase [Marinoscillum sp. 108]|uniref:1-acyl-sn-glycerol-3-phosphate acyltransferase n=1 Tax=Marinoscillum sp. 108 TaxID=2653151 RepID=UPI001C871CAB|nr:1-acyl-sn-glycerol-3-phosphate acyltransferase [Marinoscillum sp. 108]